MLQTLETSFYALFSRHCDAFLLYDLDGNVVTQNAAAARLRRISPWDAILDEPLQSAAFVEAYSGVHRALEFPLPSAEGQLNIRLDLAPVMMEEKIAGLTAIARDVRVTFAPADVAESEGLLPSMPILYDRMARLLSAMRRDGRPFAVHALSLVAEGAAADVLFGPVEQTFIARLIDTVRSVDTVARMGRHFLVVQAEFADQEGVDLLAQRLLMVMQEPIIVGGETVRMKARMGTAVATRRTMSVDDLLGEVDLALGRQTSAQSPVRRVEGT